MTEKGTYDACYNSYPYDFHEFGYDKDNCKTVKGYYEIRDYGTRDNKG